MTSEARTMVFVSHATPEENEFARGLSLQLAKEGYPRLVRRDHAPREVGPGEVNSAESLETTSSGSAAPVSLERNCPFCSNNEVPPI